MEQETDRIDERDPNQRIAELEQQVKAQLQEIAELQKKVVDWHSAMFGALNLILRPYRDNLEIEREHMLNLMPTRIDCLVIKKNSALPIELNAFRLFEKYNVIELKSYQDALNIDVLWHTIAYAYQYMSMEAHPGDIRPEEVTVTLLRSAVPRKLLRDLTDSGWTVEETYHNVFYLSGRCMFPIQIVVARDLGDLYLPLQILTGAAKEAEVRKFLEFREGLTDKADRDFANAVLYACTEANRDLFFRMAEDEKVNGVLYEIFHDDIVKAWQEGQQEGRQEGRQKGRQEGTAETLNAIAQRMIAANSLGETISQFTGLGRKEIDHLAKKMNQQVLWANSGRT